MNRGEQWNSRLGFLGNRFWHGDLPEGSLLKSALGNTVQGIKEAEIGRISTMWCSCNKGLNQSLGESWRWDGPSGLPWLEAKGPGFCVSLSLGHWMWNAFGEAHQLGRSISFQLSEVSGEAFHYKLSAGNALDNTGVCMPLSRKGIWAVHHSIHYKKVQSLLD